MSNESIEKTAFITQDGQYKYLRMPFGLCNSPSVFQYLMDKVLRQLRFTKVLVYLDDILTASQNVEENFEILQEVLKRLDAHNLTQKYIKM